MNHLPCVDETDSQGPLYVEDGFRLSSFVHEVLGSYVESEYRSGPGSLGPVILVPERRNRKELGFTES